MSQELIATLNASVTTLDAPDDGPSALCRDRCLYYVKNPPPPDWQRVWEMVSK